MDVMLQEIESLRVPDAFAPVVGYRRFGIPGPYYKNDYLVQKGQYWGPRTPPWPNV